MLAQFSFKVELGLFTKEENSTVRDTLCAEVIRLQVRVQVTNPNPNPRRSVAKKCSRNSPSKWSLACFTETEEKGVDTVRCVRYNT